MKVSFWKVFNAYGNSGHQDGNLKLSGWHIHNRTSIFGRSNTSRSISKINFWETIKRRKLNLIVNSYRKPFNIKSEPFFSASIAQRQSTSLVMRKRGFNSL